MHLCKTIDVRDKTKKPCRADKSDDLRAHRLRASFCSAVQLYVLYMT
jgi:hypothetical protein